MLNVFLKPEFKHLVGFVENDRLDVAEIDIASFDVIDDAPSSPNENLNSSVKLTSLLLDRNTAIDSNAGVLGGSVLQL
jgi:hypothetical protein